MFKDISTFKEFDEYCKAIIWLLDFIDRSSFGSNLYLNPIFNEEYIMGIKDHGRDGHDYYLSVQGEVIACTGYYKLDKDDSAWSEIKENGLVHIYCFSDFRPNLMSATHYKNSKRIMENDIPYNIADYNEAMFEQLQFLHPEHIVKSLLATASIEKSDPKREFRQFVYKEIEGIDIFEVVEKLKELENDKS